MPSTKVANLQITEGSTEILPSDLRIFVINTDTTSSRLRVSALRSSIRSSNFRLIGAAYSTRSSGLRLWDLLKTSQGSNLRLLGPANSILPSGLRLWDEPIGATDGNIGIRQLGRLALSNRESESRATVRNLSSRIRVSSVEYSTLGSSLYISFSFRINSDLRLSEIFTSVLASRIRVTELQQSKLSSSMWIYSEMPTVEFGTFPNVILDGYSTEG